MHEEHEPEERSTWCERERERERERGCWLRAKHGCLFVHHLEIELRDHVVDLKSIPHSHVCKAKNWEEMEKDDDQLCREREREREVSVGIWLELLVARHLSHSNHMRSRGLLRALPFFFFPLNSLSLSLSLSLTHTHTHTHTHTVTWSWDSSSLFSSCNYFLDPLWG